MDKLKNRISENKFVYAGSIISFVVLMLIVFLFPVEFSGYRNSDSTAPVWYFLSLTGGVYGGLAIAALLCAYLLIHFKKNSKKIGNVFLFIIIIFAFEILISASTLYYFKDIFQNPRPTQLYFTEKGLIENSESEFIAMSPEEKRKFIQKKIYEDDSKFAEVYPPILNSWINDSGYSFPSGHSQTSFFLGTILAFVVYRTGSNKYYVIIPLLWAILVALSRVVTGMHYPLDVTAGAFMGLLLALILISLKKINAIFE